MTSLLAAALLVVSIDGLDQRYLEDSKLKIPNLRRVLREGEWSRGVIGIVPTVTWPSHTTIISGAEAWDHGILSNRRPAEEGGEYYWDVNLLKRPTLLDAAAKAGRRVGVITWPVTVNAPVALNLPEYFKRRRGGYMDTASICSKAKPATLCQDITARFPSFPQEWMDDRTRTLAVRYFFQDAKADAVFVHLVDLDSEAHDTGPFSLHANAIVERTDELLGEMLAALPAGGRLVLVSDHGFERAARIVNLPFAAARDRVAGIDVRGGFVIAETPAAAQWLRSLGPEYGIGRPIPEAEVARFAPPWKGKFLFESAPGIWFGSGTDVLSTTPKESGNHGHWPTRYRSIYAAWGPGIPAARLPEMRITEIAGRLAGFLSVKIEGR
ncbi:MAG TPA: ectonucleotide pyrophosphatase/phosphodiesterase [Bryobacteraceae bacterium]|nr:ectonucleotide pyrophosphatase/phosphodiesterase [Bryobacteraceae bacterium]